MEKSASIQLVLLALASAGFYQLLISSARIKNRVCKSSTRNEANNKWHLFQRFTGAIILGIIPFAFNTIFADSLFDFPGVSIGNVFNGFSISIYISLLLVVVNLIIASRKEHHIVFPYLKYNEWNFKFTMINVASWSAYLVAYEYLLRGVLLFAAAHVAGNFIAIVLNLAVYSLMHYNKGRQQLLACIPFGLLMCIISLATQSFAGAALIHLSFAISFEGAVLHHKKLQLRKSQALYTVNE